MNTLCGPASPKYDRKVVMIMAGRIQKPLRNCLRPSSLLSAQSAPQNAAENAQ